MRSSKPELVYVCDPVLGDNGKFYVPTELLEGFRDQLIPLATVITPNFFEAQVLSGVSITSFQSAIDACRRLHALGPTIVCLKGLPLDDIHDDMLSILLSKRLENGKFQIYRKNVRKIKGNFSGCGDLFTALLTGHILENSRPLGQILDDVASVMLDVVQLTQSRNSKELCVVEAMHLYRLSHQLRGQERAYLAYGPVTGVIFDLDGTLTKPGAIDFKQLYARLNLEAIPNYDIIERVNSIPDEFERRRLWEIVDDEELKAEARMELQPNVKTAIEVLEKNRVRVSIATRNNMRGVKHFVSKAGFDDFLFSPVVTRACLGTINKPNPEVAKHILREWGIEDSSQVWFVGDSIDDMKCGKGAGCKTCLLLNERNRQYLETQSDFIDFGAESLSSFVDLLQLHSRAL